jgi:Ca2+-binding RTX toxin-like protein
MSLKSTFRTGTSRAIVVLVTGLLLALPMTPSAQATNSTCGYSAEKERVDVQIVTPTAITVFVEPDDQIKWRNTLTMETFDCAKATVNNTDQIWINDFNSVSDSELTLDLTEPFAPGATPESVGFSEIEFFVDGGSAENELQIHGGPDSDRMAFGEEGINLNRDSDDDVTIDDLQTYVLLGNLGKDILTGAGGFGTGGPFPQGLTMYGGGGRDAMTGSNEEDTMGGSAGKDEMNGAGAKDIVFGDAGDDNLKGGAGGDEIDGIGGDDKLFGQRGSDDLEGGPGTDVCKGGPGADTETTCELP